MESFLQFRRIKKAVREELALVKEKCDCPDYVLGGAHRISCDLNPRSENDEEQLEKGEKSGKPDPTDECSVDSSLILVGWAGEDDPLNPANFSMFKKIFITVMVTLIGLTVIATAGIDAVGNPQYSAEWGVSTVVGALASGLFLIGVAVGCLFAGPFSETFGRNVVYMVTMFVYAIFLMAAGLAPNIQSHLIFRFLAGFFGSTPLSCAGGTVADIWNPLHKTFAFPIYGIPAFAGPVFGELIGSYIPTSHLGWRWLEYIMCIQVTSILVGFIFFVPETYSNVLIKWKAQEMRKATGDDRYKAPAELKLEGLGTQLLHAMYRPFLWSYSELIIMLISLYMMSLYVVLFTFLEGYNFIFGDTYGLSQPMTSIAWAGMLVGCFMVIFIIPVVYSWTAKELKTTGRIRPELRLLYAMLGGAPAIPISLFWMGWTSFSHISIWSPLVASALFGFGITTIWIVAYMYLIDSYGIYSASALGFMGFSRYMVGGGMTVAGAPIYRSIGVQYTLTILGAISSVMASVPYLLYFFGPRIRKASRFAVKPDN